MYPSEIEAVLKTHPGVADAVVVGVPDPSRGRSIVARVVPREGVALTDAQVLEHCRALLPDYKVPRRVLIVEQIPKSPVGKPLRRARQAAERCAARGPARRRAQERVLEIPAEHQLDGVDARVLLVEPAVGDVVDPHLKEQRRVGPNSRPRPSSGSKLSFSPCPSTWESV